MHTDRLHVRLHAFRIGALISCVLAFLTVRAQAEPAGGTDPAAAPSAMAQLDTSPAAAPVVRIGTGPPSGVSFVAGGAICRMLNRHPPPRPLVCSAEATAGAVANINSVTRGRLELSIAQSDVESRAVAGFGDFAARGPRTSLRSLFAIFVTPVTIIVRDGLPATSVESLKGLRVNLGALGSGGRAFADLLLPELGVSTSDMALAVGLSTADNERVYCSRKLDALIYVTGLGSENAAAPLRRCGGRILPLEGPAIADWLTRHPHYVATTIPGGTYPNNDHAVPTIGTVARLLGDARTEPDTIYWIVRRIFENLDEFKSLHPAFAPMDAKSMIRLGMAAPLHEGAARYYRERGWL